MSRPHLTDHELELVRSVFRRHPHLEGVILFGSRALGTHATQSDVDLAITGDVPPLEAEAIAGELDELPLPYRFEVQPLGRITHPPLRAHIERVGISIYPAA
ncbi:nucleotidyltransferase domain-containing protein [bacterium]|nr:nucleotidyltransferase domain-containing protein [bacterium]